MGQEFIIKSQKLEDKVNQLLPSQGGFQAGVDLSASTTVIPIVDLTETAEGSDVRQDLQTAFSHKTMTSFVINNATTTIINTTGYFRIIGFVNFLSNANFEIKINDGTTDKTIVANGANAGATVSNLLDIIVFLEAGDSVIVVCTGTGANFIGTSRQIADIAGNLINP